MEPPEFDLREIYRKLMISLQIGFQHEVRCARIRSSLRKLMMTGSWAHVDYSIICTTSLGFGGDALRQGHDSLARAQPSLT